MNQQQGQRGVSYVLNASSGGTQINANIEIKNRIIKGDEFVKQEDMGVAATKTRSKTNFEISETRRKRQPRAEETKGGSKGRKRKGKEGARKGKEGK